MFSKIKQWWLSDLPWSKGLAVHIGQGNRHAVVIENMRVLIVPDSANLWFAQGIDIDYAAGGESMEEAQLSFELGLAATIKAHLEHFGSIEKIMRTPEPERWMPLITREGREFEASIKITHAIENTALNGVIPYKKITYYSDIRQAA